MTINHCRIALALILVWVYFLPGFILPYVVIWFFLLELLNRQKEYTVQPKYKAYNFIFVAYVVVLFNRFLHFRITHFTREVINRGEHLLFCFVVCLAILQFLRLNYFKQYDIRKRLFITSLVFQSIGFLNEIYQASWDVGYLRIYFSQDAIHDLITNISGNILFVAFMAFTKDRRSTLQLTQSEIKTN